MKRILAIAILAVSFCLLAASARAEKQNGLNGLYLFVELETEATRPADSKLFSTVIDLSEMAKQPYQPMGRNSAARRICLDKIDGVDYGFWIEAGRELENSNYFRFSVNQLKDGLGFGGVSGNINLETARDYNGLYVLHASSGNPAFIVRIYAFFDERDFFKRHDFSSHKKLNCYYPLYTYPKASE